jgi:hypothetical protein
MLMGTTLSPVTLICITYTLNKGQPLNRVKGRKKGGTVKDGLREGTRGRAKGKRGRTKG